MRKPSPQFVGTVSGLLCNLLLPSFFIYRNKYILVFTICWFGYVGLCIGEIYTYIKGLKKVSPAFVGTTLGLLGACR